MLNYRRNLGLLALVCTFAGLAGCGGGSGTDNNPVTLPACRDPLVLLDNGVCGEPRDPYVRPPCPEGQIYNSDGNCVVPNFPAPVRFPTDDEAIIYVNVDGNDSEKAALFASYNLHLWQDCGNGWGGSMEDGRGATYSIPTTWPVGPGASSGVTLEHDPVYGAYFIIPISKTGGTCGNYIVKTPGGAAQTNDLQMQIRHSGGDYDRMAWIIVNTSDMRNSRVSNIPICINDNCSLIRPRLAISDTEAHWISPHTIIWSRDFAADKTVELYRSTAGGMAGAEDGSIIGGSLLATLSPGREMTDDEKLLVPHLANYVAYDLPNDLTLDTIKSVLKDELLIVGRYDATEETEEGPVIIERGQATRIQLPHVLDALYTAGANDADEATLGVSYGDGVSVSVWAPTAQQVELRIYSGNPLRVADTKVMTLDNATGIWRYQGTRAELDRKFYRFRVTTYNPIAKKIHRLEVTDPYSISLSTNSRYSQFVNFDDADLKPAGWDGHMPPPVTAPEAMSIYEVHVRDISINDATTSAQHRGKYMAFTETNSAAMRHLQELASAGLTHIHTLPTNDMSTVNEDAAAQINLDSYRYQLCARVPDREAVAICNDPSYSNSSTLRSIFESFDPLSDQARTLMSAMENLDGFNWGYDPQHFNVPEGSYATNPDGFLRIKEMRAMNMALHQMGLRVVMDVVYPHTISSGVEVANSIFDKIVPGYYYRGHPTTGLAEQGTGAGPDTATEHRMMGKFVVDSVVQWAQHYKVNGFRFDQSGFMPKAVLVEAYEAVKAIDPDNYFYAEAWTPHGGSSGERIAELAVQRALAGTGIGTFNDVMRNPLQQFNLIKGGNVDQIRAGLAGNLKDFELKARNGSVIKAEQVGAYNLDPQEAINYVEKHDNETLWDWMHHPRYAVPADTSLANRVRIHNLTLSIPVLSQGVPFIHLGSDLLRSKSMSPNSYNAGDWFNVVDFTRQSNNWAVGLPPELRDGVTDEHVIDLFNNPETKPGNAEIELASQVFQEFLSIATGSPLFSLQTAQDVIDRVGFHDGGLNYQPGIIVLSIDDGAGVVYGTDSTARADLDTSVDALVVIVNGTSETKSAHIITSTGFVLHDRLQNSADMQVRSASFTEGDEGGTFTVPAYTTAVFVKPQSGAQGAGLYARATLELSEMEPPPYANSVHVRGNIYDAGWSADSGNEMTYHGQGIYSVVLDVLPGDYQFKLGAPDWSTPNLGGSTPVTVGGNTALAQGGGDLSITIADAGQYRFELDASASISNPVLRVFPDAFSGVSVHLRGTVTSTGWDTGIDNALNYEGNNMYSLIVDLAASAQAYEFKVASDDWSTVNLSSEDPVIIGAPLPLSSTYNGNIQLLVETSGRYRIEVNMQNPAAPVLRVYLDDIFKGIPFYARGSVSATGWNTGEENQFTYRGAGRYTLTLPMTAGNHQFKIAEEGWSYPNLGTDAVLVVGTPTLVTQGSNDNINMVIPTAGNYQFILDTSLPDAVTLTVAAIAP